MEEELEDLYTVCLKNVKVILPITMIGKNLRENIYKKLNNTYGGKCIAEGYVKSESINIIEISSGRITKGTEIEFDVVISFKVCYPVKDMIITCRSISVTKAGIRAELANERPSPLIVYIARDHYGGAGQDDRHGSGPSPADIDLSLIHI